MKTSKLFVPEKDLDPRIKYYLDKVEYVQKPYDHEELGIGAITTLPEGFVPKEEKPKDFPEGLKITIAELEKRILEEYTIYP